ncbi:MAG: hypothetical protein IPK32_13985 [Verrucomicrobiaceae bacterium]|nr:hypothetical protein [Verrucomicrobiaceae bacterium]
MRHLLIRGSRHEPVWKLAADTEAKLVFSIVGQEAEDIACDRFEEGRGDFIGDAPNVEEIWARGLCARQLVNA